MIDWQKILTGSQIPIFLLAVCYFVKRHYDLKTKKIEINHSLFQQNRINAVTTFFSAYAKAEFMWNQLSYWDALEHKLSSKAIDEIIGPPLNELRRAVLELKIYFSPDEHNNFDTLLSNFLLINNNLSKNYFDYSTDNTIINKTNDFLFFKDKKLRENKIVIENLTTKIRNSFSDKN